MAAFAAGTMMAAFAAGTTMAAFAAGTTMAAFAAGSSGPRSRPGPTFTHAHLRVHLPRVWT